jgi:BsuBI/PstI restriction endonuclease HTH domain
MLPPLLAVDAIRERLRVIFPDGTPERSKCTGLAAARTIFVMLYVGAIEGGEWLAPKFVYRMGDTQATKTSEADRLAYLAAVKKPGTPEPPDRWYRENTRESIRDEVLGRGLVPIGAVLINSQVPTTSAKGRYVLRSALAALFDPALMPVQFEKAAASWRAKHLSQNALAVV